MTEKVEQLLNKFKGDIMMLDALYQWANNETGITAIRKRHYAYHYPIKKNLAIRYNLSPEKAEEAYTTLRKEIDSAGLDFRKDFSDVNSEINGYFETNGILKDTVLDRLVSATEKEKYIAWLYYYYFRERELQQNIFSARLHATFGTVEEEIVNTLIRLGLLNQIKWISSSGNHLDQFEFPKHYLSSIPPIEEYIQLPPLPDFEKYIDLLFEKKRSEALIALDYLLGCDNGYAQDSDKFRDLLILPAIVARSSGYCAVNCRILEELRNYFYKRKSAEITEISKKLHEVLTKLVEVDLSISFSERERLEWERTVNAKKIWDVHPLDRSLLDKDMLIVLAPWLSYEIGHLISDAKSKYVFIITTMMGIPELNELYRADNPKNINEPESDLIILDLSKDEVRTLVVRGKPKLYEEIIEGLRKPELQKPKLPEEPIEPATIKIRPKSEKYRDKVLDAVYHINDKSVDLTLQNDKKKTFNPERKNSSALSTAANYVTKASVNGWIFWEYYDRETNSWILIDELRKEKRPVVGEVQGKVATSGVSKSQIGSPSSKPEEIVIGSGSKSEEEFEKGGIRSDDGGGAASLQSDEKRSGVAGLAIFLGLSENKKVFWQLGKLTNGHFIIIGGSGAGKTETLRCIASEIAKQKFPVVMIDFHGDMACDNCELKSYEIKEESEYYFNPFELNPDFNEITPLRAGSDFVDAIFINFPGLGVQQRNKLKEIIKNAYSSNGITNETKTWRQELKFDVIEQQIKNSDDQITQTVNAYLGDIFNYKLFSGTEKISISNILQSGITRINLKPLPESLRALYADLFLRKIYYTMQAVGEIPRGNIEDKDKFRLFVIVDEAKLLVREQQGVKAVLNKYATELRKYGVGLILASQLIDHFTDEILSNIATKLCMKAESKKEAQKNCKFFGVEESFLLSLEQGNGILVRGQDKMNIKIVPTWER